MTIELFKRLNEGDRDSASEQNRLRATVEGLTNFSGPRLTHSEAGTAYSPPDAEHFSVKITAVATVAGKFAYSWTEQQDLADGSFIDKPGGLSGTSTYLPLYERNNVGTVAINSIVEAAQGTGLFFVFDAPDGSVSSGSLTVQEADGSPTVTAVTSIAFNQDDGLSVTDLTGGAVGIGVTQSMPWCAPHQSGTNTDSAWINTNILNKATAYLPGCMASYAGGVGGSAGFLSQIAGSDLPVAQRVKMIFAVPYIFYKDLTILELAAISIENNVLGGSTEIQLGIYDNLVPGSGGPPIDLYPNALLDHVSITGADAPPVNEGGWLFTGGVKPVIGRWGKTVSIAVTKNVVYWFAFYLDLPSTPTKWLTVSGLSLQAVLGMQHAVRVDGGGNYLFTSSSPGGLLFASQPNAGLPATFPVHDGTTKFVWQGPTTQSTSQITTIVPIVFWRY